MSDVPPRIDPAAVRSAQFQGSFRKYDSKAVDQYLEALADQLAKVNNYIDELERKVAAAPRLSATEPEPAPAPQPAAEPPALRTLSDDEIATLVGEETAHVLATARRAAEEIRTKAEESAARMIREATHEAAESLERAHAELDEVRQEAEQARDKAVAKAETEAKGIVDKATADADRRVAEARAMADEELVRAERVRAEVDAEAERVRTEAKEEGRSMLAEAKDVRNRILEDLQRRRDLGRAQIERLVVGRDRLLEAYAVVRENVDEMTAELTHVLDEPFEHDPALEEGFVGIVSTAAPEIDEVGVGTDEVGAELEPDEAPADDAPVETDVEDEPAESEPDTDEPAVSESAESEPAEEAPSAEPTAAPVDDVSDDDSATETASSGEEDDVDVDELFARMRADREQSVARAHAVLSATGDEAVADETSSGDADTEPDIADADDATSSASTPSEIDAVPAEYLASGASYEHRSELLAGATKTLSRALKRLLADEQNEVLDALRRTESTDLADVLPGADDHVISYAEVATTTLAEVAVAAAGQIDAEVTTVDVSDLAAGLGGSLTEPLRRRIERAAADVDGDHEELDERLRSLYREWKVEQIGRLTSDALVSAYALGQMAAAPSGGSIRWLIDPATGPCPDCQDNALEGAVTVGDAFPTGDTRPQAHSGCSCMLRVEREG